MSDNPDDPDDDDAWGWLPGWLRTIMPLIELFVPFFLWAFAITLFMKERV